MPPPPPAPVPYVVVPAEDHASLAVAGGADLAELSLAAGALEAARVPVALHGVEQKAVSDLPPAARAGPGGRAPAGHSHRLGLRGAIIHHVTGCRERGESVSVDPLRFY